MWARSPPFFPERGPAAAIPFFIQMDEVGPQPLPIYIVTMDRQAVALPLYSKQSWDLEAVALPL